MTRTFLREEKSRRRSNASLHKTRKEISMKKIISILCVVAFSAGLSACNTMQGVGKDVERGGEKVQDAATKNK